MYVLPRAPRRYRGWLVLGLFGCLGAAPDAWAAAMFESRLDLTMTVDTPRQDKTLAYATDFGGGQSWLPRAPQYDSGKPVDETTGSGVTVERTRQAGGTGDAFNGRNRMGLAVEGFAAAGPQPNSSAEIALWASGRSRIGLANLTGWTSDHPAATDLTVDLTVAARSLLSSIAQPNPREVDRAAAKYLFRAVDGRTGAVLLQEVVESLLVKEGQTDHSGPTDHSLPFQVTVPATDYAYVDLEAYVFGQAWSYSAGNDDPDAVAKNKAKAAAFDAKLDLPYPDPAIPLQGSWRPLLGGARVGEGGRLTGGTGVQGDDPDAIGGLNTLSIDETLIMPNRPIDVEISVETPIGGETLLAIQKSLFAPGGRSVHGLELSIGIGMGDDFLPSDDLESVALLGELGELNPTAIHGDGSVFPVLAPGERVASLFTDVEMAPYDELFLTFGAHVDDAADGVIDGMARFTLRQWTGGVAGDYDGDGIVGPGDQAAWSEAYWSDDPLLVQQVDGNGDGLADAADYTLWRDNAAALADAVTVPEPSTALAILSAVVASSASNRNRRR